MQRDSSTYCDEPEDEEDYDKMVQEMGSYLEKVVSEREAKVCGTEHTYW